MACSREWRWARPSVPALTNRFLQTPRDKSQDTVESPAAAAQSVMIMCLVGERSCDLWKGEQCMEWTGPLQGLNEKTAGALSATLCPSEGAAAGVWEEKEHLSSRPPSEPTKKVSESQGDRAREVTPTVLLPRA